MHLLILEHGRKGWLYFLIQTHAHSAILLFTYSLWRLFSPFFFFSHVYFVLARMSCSCRFLVVHRLSQSFSHSFIDSI